MKKVYDEKFYIFKIAEIQNKFDCGSRSKIYMVCNAWHKSKIEYSHRKFLIEFNEASQTESAHKIMSGVKISGCS